ncbi:MAG TPA: VOC family protein [Caulobacteraceae bacterium]|jgi:predicted lactoylglutathione lyase
MNAGWLETSFAVVDVERTRAFYEALGFVVVDTADEGRSHTMVAGDCRVSIFQGVLDPPETQLIFWNGDVEAMMDKLVAAGAEIVLPSKPSPHTQPSGLVTPPNGDACVMVRDPDGQLLFLIRMAEVTRSEPAGPPLLALGRYDVALPVKDVARTVAFYELLGFERRPLPEDEARVAAMVCGDARITLYQGYLDPAEPQLNFWQGDIDAVAEQARRQGLGFFREPAGDDSGRAFMLKDPDGRPLFFINMRKYGEAPRP